MIDKQRIRTFILGGAVGALVGIVLAPRSGKEFRGSIADRAGEARDRSRENYFETQERLRERLAGMGEGETRRPMNPEEVSLGTTDPGTPVQEPSPEPSPEPSAHQPHLRGLRDVSIEKEEPPVELPAQAIGQSEDDGPTQDRMGDRSEELRRKVQETRDRLRRQSEDPDDGRA